jgi:rapamycin-insensitive companion of mTOR
MYKVLTTPSLKLKKAEGFQKQSVFHKVMVILESHRYHLSTCHFVLNLFERDVLKQVVLDEDESSGGSEEQSSGEESAVNSNGNVMS